jgi:peptidoglycan/xylan/chitin deacetylase (PgdA/CDA1 family)
MPRLRRFLVAGFLVLVLIIGGASFGLSGRYVVPVMMYHNVGYTDVLKPNTVSPENFERQMAYLKDHGFHAASFDDFVQSIVGGPALPRKSVVITFDDAYEDNYTHAFPALKKYGFPAIVFAPSDLIGTPGHLTWDQAREMMKGGVTFGSHTRSHAYLPDLPSEDQLDEIRGSKRILEQQLGVSVDFLAYPIGGFNERIKAAVREAGYKAACATNRGYDRYNKDVFELKRVRFSDKDNRKDYLWIKLSGYYNLFREAKSPD